MKPVKPSPTPFRAEACQGDHGESTCIMAADGFVVATINSPVWDAGHSLQYPQDRANLDLILNACNGHQAFADPRLQDLSMLVERLARRLAKADPTSARPAEALAYLERVGLTGSPLRALQALVDQAQELDMGYGPPADSSSAAPSDSNSVEIDGIAALAALPTTKEPS